MAMGSGQPLTGDDGAKSGPNIEKALPKKPQVSRKLQIVGTVSIVLLSGIMAIHNALNPQPTNSQGQIDLYYHPVARVAGSLIPTIILAPVAYWMFGKLLRRGAARYKVCEFCAETIKSEAKVCRYCGREVTPNRTPSV
jgi:hypothetical protein